MVIAAHLSFFLLSQAEAQSVVDIETYDLSYSKGLLEFGQGHYEKAERLFERALQAKPGDHKASDFLGQTWLRLDKYEQAEKMFHRLAAAYPTNGKVFLSLGIAQYNLNQFVPALDSLSQAEQLIRDDPLVFYFQGLASYKLHHFDQSIDFFSRAMTLSPDLTASARYYTGVAYYRLGELEKAQKEFESAILAGELDEELARSAKEYLGQGGVDIPVRNRWDVNVSLSGQYDSNVVLLPLGIQPPGGQSGISDKDDFRSVFQVRGEFRPIQTDDWTMGLNYGFYQSFHRTLSAFDLQNHSPAIYLQHQWGPAELRFHYGFDYVEVGRSPFLAAHALLPTVTFSLSETAFTQFLFRYQNKDFRDGRFLRNSTRDGKNWLAGISQYLFFANGKGNLRLGYSYDTDITGGGSLAMATPGIQTAADWSYQAHRLSSALAVPLPFQLNFNVALDYYRQNYDNPSSFSPTGTTKRQDDVFFITETLSRKFGEHFSLAVEYNFTRNRSNIAVFDYERSIFSLTLNSTF